MSKKISFQYEHFEKLWNKATEEQKKFMKIVNSINKNIFNRIKKDGFVNAISSDKFLRFILYHGIKNERIKIKYKNNYFPDLFINDEIDLEIKRLTTTRNIQEYLENVNSKNSHKLFLVLFFPQVLNEDTIRLKELTDGYYFVKPNLKNNFNVDMLILYPTPYNFQEILEKIINCIQNPNWCKND